MEVRAFGYSDDEDHSSVLKTDMLFLYFYAIVLFIFEIKKRPTF